MLNKIIATFKRIFGDNVTTFDIKVFNEKFVAGNELLKLGTGDGLADSIKVFKESLSIAGPSKKSMRQVVDALQDALRHFDRAHQKGPWNRDLSGYGVMSWQSDMQDGEEFLQLAWSHIKVINEELQKEGLGWDSGR